MKISKTTKTYDESPKYQRIGVCNLLQANTASYLGGTGNAKVR